MKNLMNPATRPGRIHSEKMNGQPLRGLAGKIDFKKCTAWKVKEPIDAGFLQSFRIRVRISPWSFSHIGCAFFLLFVSSTLTMGEISESEPIPPISYAYYHFCLGVLLEKEGKWEKALEEFQEALQFSPDAG